MADVTLGWVAGTFVLPGNPIVVDTLTGYSAGLVKLTPLDQPNGVVREPVLLAMNTAGTVKAEVATGLWSVSAFLHDGSPVRDPFDVRVDTSHTEANPLDLNTAAPPVPSPETVILVSEAERIRAEAAAQEAEEAAADASEAALAADFSAQQTAGHATAAQQAAAQAGSLAFNAGASATAAQSSEDGARAAATAASGSASSAAGSATAASGSASAALLAAEHAEAVSTDGVYVSERSKPRRPLIDTMVERFAPGHGWVILSSTAASMVDDASDFALGSQSLRVTTKTDGTPGSVQKTGLSLDLTGRQIVLWVKVTGATVLNQLLLYAGDTTMANNFSWTIANAGVGQQVFREGEWAPVVLSFADAAATGSPNRANISTLRVRTGASNGSSVTLRLGGIGLSGEPLMFPNGVVSFTCDDSYASQFNALRPALDKYGWGATAYTIVDLLGTPGYMTLDQLNKLEQSHGWEVAGHSFTAAMHAAGYGDASTLEAIEADVRALRRWLLANGFRGAEHLAYPKGFFTAESQAVMGRYFATGRTVINRMAETLRPSDRMRLRSLSVTNTTTLATAKALVDRVKNGKAWGIITIHDLVVTPTVGTHWAIADLQALVDYVAAQGIPVMTVSEVTARLT